jgi:hypothetical protein
VSPSASKRATSSDLMLGDGLTDIATLFPRPPPGRRPQR